ncbi:hypothetical protein HNQ07_001192 [Deinococcus metalli]|uniref:Uncharacterized protein n=1 Tax=Deinococcus metalli TaxID=1141878 RepID=A0A7W8KD37_9DEIO|nr:hypothetical protein [Deinococcus metalli]MBB5375735.1 hypothetical protein [Deinococcus metalli]GHF37438.1 hypothetical protein GCM10017781_12660 [Deinococcus metalli]
MLPHTAQERRASSVRDEMERGAALLQRGVSALAQETYSGSTDRFLFMTDLAGGTERMLKLAWALGTLQARGALPSIREVGGMTGQLRRLSDAVADLYPSRFLRTEDGRWGQDYLRSGRWYREALDILDDLSGLGAVQAWPWAAVAGVGSPEERWAALELKVAATTAPASPRRAFRLVSPGDHWRLHAGIHAELARSFELLGYALYRLLSAGLPRTDAATWAPHWDRFTRVRPPGFATAWFEEDR